MRTELGKVAILMSGSPAKREISLLIKWANCLGSITTSNTANAFGNSAMVETLLNTVLLRIRLATIPREFHDFTAKYHENQTTYPDQVRIFATA